MGSAGSGSPGSGSPGSPTGTGASDTDTAEFATGAARNVTGAGRSDTGTAGSATGAARNVTRSTVLSAHLETAGSLWGKFMGLMGRASLPADGGLWLPASNGIHMMFMRFPIDAVFVSRPDADGTRTVKSVHRGLRAWTGFVPLVWGADGVLELPSGTIDATGTAVGDRLEIRER